MEMPAKLGQLALNKRSGRPRLEACDAQNLGHKLAYLLEFPLLRVTKNKHLSPSFCPGQSP
jgi:hypothetical protein